MTTNTVVDPGTAMETEPRFEIRPSLESLKGMAVDPRWLGPVTETTEPSFNSSI